jgi:class 3 adenylate cyclase
MDKLFPATSPRTFSVPITTMPYIIGIWLGLALPVGFLITSHFFSEIDGNTAFYVRERETQATRFLEEMQSHLSVEKALKTYLTENWHALKDGFFKPEGFHQVKRWFPNATIMYLNDNTNELLDTIGDKPIPFFPYKKLIQGIAKVACRDFSLVPAEIADIDRFFGKDFHLYFSTDNQLYPAELIFEKDRWGWMIWGESLIDEGRKVLCLMILREKDIPIDFPFRFFWKKADIQRKSRGMTVGWYSPAKRTGRLLARGSRRKDLRTLLPRIRDSRRSQLRLQGHFSEIRTIDDLRVFACVKTGDIAARTGPQKIQVIGFTFLLLACPLGVLLGFRKNQGSSLPLRLLLLSVFLLTLGLPVTGLYRISRDYLRDLERNLTNDGFYELDGFAKAISQGTQNAKERYEDNLLDFIKKHRLEDLSNSEIEEAAKHPASGGALLALSRSMIKNMTETRTMNSVYLMNQRGEVLKFGQYPFSRIRKVGIDNEIWMRTIGENVLQSHRVFAGKTSFAAAAMGGLIETMRVRGTAKSGGVFRWFTEEGKVRNFALEAESVWVYSKFLRKRENDVILLLTSAYENEFSRLYLTQKIAELYSEGFARDLFIFGVKNLSRIQDPVLDVEPEDIYPANAALTRKLSALVRQEAMGTLAEGLVERKILTVNGADYLFSATRVPGLLGFSLFLLKPVAEIHRSIRIKERKILGYLGLAVFIAVILSLLIRRAILQPLTQISQGVAAVAGGDYLVKVELHGENELVELSSTFNRMTRGLHEKEIMSQFISDSTREAVESSDSTLSQGRQIQGVVLFSDIRSFTTLSETYPPEVIVNLLNEHFTRMFQVIRSHRGDIDKFIGDAIMAVFLPQEGEARGPETARRLILAALRCGLDMTAAVCAFNEERLRAGDFPIQIGVGINWGDLIVGTIGAPGRRDFTVIGDTVNLASRLEGLSKLGRTTFTVSNSETIAYVHAEVETRDLGDVPVKGKSRATRLLEILSVRD